MDGRPNRRNEAVFSNSSRVVEPTSFPKVVVELDFYG